LSQDLTLDVDDYVIDIEGEHPLAGMSTTEPHVMEMWAVSHRGATGRVDAVVWALVIANGVRLASSTTHSVRELRSWAMMLSTKWRGDGFLHSVRYPIDRGSAFLRGLWCRVAGGSWDSRYSRVAEFAALS
jgi:hypothetical protein